MALLCRVRAAENKQGAQLIIDILKNLSLICNCLKMLIIKRLKPKPHLITNLFWTSRSVEKMGDNMLTSINEMKKDLQLSQLAVEQRLKESQLAIQRRLEESQDAAEKRSKELLDAAEKRSKELLDAAEKRSKESLDAAEKRSEKSQAAHEKNILNAINANNWKLLVRLFTAIIFAIGCFEAVGGIIVHPWNNSIKSSPPR